ncbi:MAG: TolC family protein, partial [Flavobacteriaceae bacterium]|nr:TolC family protein [Flavobacteriaceae bacterium]
MMQKIIFILFLMVFTTAFSQEELSLTACYTLAEKHNPIAKQNELIPQQSELNTDIINTKKYPEINFGAQATYQSDVIHFPTENPGLIFELPNQDQYKTTLTLNQLIYGGGSIKAAIEDEGAKSKTQQQSVQVALYQLKPKINQLYFSILLS